jgi:hypothetical protein
MGDTSYTTYTNGNDIVYWTDAASTSAAATWNYIYENGTFQSQVHEAVKEATLDDVINDCVRELKHG